MSRSDAGAPPPELQALFAEPARVPLVYPRLRAAETPAEVQRVAESRFHRAPVYACLGFHRHLSRCVRLDGEG